MDLKWVGCQYPTPALAQEAEMSVDAFADFLYGACLLDWDAERERMQRYAERFDQADEVRLVAADTDVRLSITGRPTLVDAGGANMPGGEFFTSPVEDSAEGEIVVRRVPGGLQRPRGDAGSGFASRAGRSSTPRRRRTRSSCSSSSTSTRAREASASSGSAAIPVSRGT